MAADGAGPGDHPDRLAAYQDAAWAGASLALEARGLLVGLVARTVAYWRAQEDRAWADLEGERAATRAALCRAERAERELRLTRGALDLAADRAVVAEARLEEARALVPALAGATTRRELAAVVAQLAEAVGR